LTTKKKGYPSKNKLSKLKTIKDRLLQWKSSFFRKSGARFGLICAAIKSGFGKFRSMPRTLRILTIYSLTVILALSVFYWRASQLREAEPPLAEPPFDWSVYLPGDPSESAASTEEKSDTTSAENVDSENSQTVEPPATTVSEAPFLRGEWPVRGELFYGFHETVIQYGPGYPLYYTSKGIAIKAASGSQAVASWNGTVIKVMELDKPHGKSVMIEHDNGLISYYGALQKVVVSVGEQVKQGQTLGLVGSGFESEPDYLYLEILKEGRVVNPIDLLLP
jgi:murein DD-endopeptidase MepM/ murein hydrolase activator NlpD